jgi:hypothetical protein
MKKTLLLFAAATIACFVLSFHAYAHHDEPAPGITKKSFSVASIRTFDQYANLLAKAKPLQVTTSRKALTNSSLYNGRPNGYSMIMPVFAITYNSYATTDYYYVDNVNNGQTVYFEVPDISAVNYIQLFQLGENFHNWEWGFFDTNGGATHIGGEADYGGGNWISFYDGNGPYDIVNGMAVTIY